MDPVDEDPGAEAESHDIRAAAPLGRLTLIISHLQMGGAERVLTELANHWVSVGWDVSIVHFSRPGTPPVFPLDPRVTEVPLDLLRPSTSPISAITGNVRRIMAVRRAIRETQPDITLSLTNRTNVLSVFATTGSRVPVIVSEHTAPRGTLTLPWRVLRELAYRRATFVVMLTSDALAQLSPGLRRRGRVIPNPLPATFLAPAPPVDEGQPADGPTIMGLGRLTPEKGFDVLIDAFARVAATRPDVRLVIWGEGDERGRLERIRAEHNLVGRVFLPGETRSPERELQRATIFVLSSRLEGLPMTLLEAMALGRAVIASDCDHGPRDIIRPGVDGLLVPPEDVEALATAIEDLLSDEGRRASLGSRAVEVRDRFALDTVASQWARLFNEARARR